MSFIRAIRHCTIILPYSLKYFTFILRLTLIPKIFYIHLRFISIACLNKSPSRDDRYIPMRREPRYRRHSVVTGRADENVCHLANIHINSCEGAERLGALRVGDVHLEVEPNQQVRAVPDGRDGVVYRGPCPRERPGEAIVERENDA